VTPPVDIKNPGRLRSARRGLFFLRDFNIVLSAALERTHGCSLTARDLAHVADTETVPALGNLNPCQPRVVSDCSVGTAENYRGDFGADNSVVREIVEPFDEFKRFGEIASHVAPR
jgi:hypothetical protein